MSKITRYSGNVAPFASAAQAGERVLFGDSSATGDTLDQNINTNWLRGWGVVGPNDFPPLEWFNSAMYSSTLLASYLYQVGIAEWDSAQEYHTGSIANIGGTLYASLTNNNIGNDPTADTVNWKEFKTELDIGGLPAKTTPDNTDNLALQETGGLLKKVSFENLTKLSPNDNRVKTALNATGDAPIYTCRAWVNFNGTGTVAIRASGNVSSITDNGVGLYVVNFATAMQDANYAAVTNYNSTNTGVGGGNDGNATCYNYSTTSLRLLVTDGGGAARDSIYVSVAIFR